MTSEKLSLVIPLAQLLLCLTVFNHVHVAVFIIKGKLGQEDGLSKKGPDHLKSLHFSLRLSK